MPNPLVEIHAVFSISAANKLQATFWVTEDANLVTSGLGQASYIVYNSEGVTVGLIEENIDANINGLYIIEPVNASVLSDLTHYVVKISAVVNGNTITTYKGITLGE